MPLKKHSSLTMKMQRQITILACALLVFASNASAASECPYSGIGQYTCKCSNGQTERHSTSQSLLEARKDPSSCCYYSPSHPPSYDAITPSKPIRDNVVYTPGAIAPVEEPPPVITPPPSPFTKPDIDPAVLAAYREQALSSPQPASPQPANIVTNASVTPPFKVTPLQSSTESPSLLHVLLKPFALWLPFDLYR
jgi:hypothetical protein